MRKFWPIVQNQFYYPFNYSRKCEIQIKIWSEIDPIVRWEVREGGSKVCVHLMMGQDQLYNEDKPRWQWFSSGCMARLGPGHSTITWDTAQTGVAVADTTGGAGRDRPTGR